MSSESSAAVVNPVRESPLRTGDGPAYAIEISNIAKGYSVYERPVDRLLEIILRKPRHTVFRPIENISLLVPNGASIGVIGNNGAGKSTLFKILAGTLKPTSGTVVTRGRVAALLELGAGFHPEFSGRANIALNATLLGLSEREIREREEEIITFSELEEFIDRPVKTYSSGMYVRLAFSIATSVDPDILIIDEALSVGDMHFQKKCVDRMMGFRERGKTIFFCTHNLYQVHELCDEAIWLDHGKIRKQGKTDEVIRAYTAHLEERREPSAAAVPELATQSGAAPDVMVERVEVCDADGAPLTRWRTRIQVRIRVALRTLPGKRPTGHIAIGLARPDGELLFVATTKHDGLSALEFSGRQTLELVLPSLPLNGGIYRVRIVVGDEHLMHFFHEFITSESFIVEGEHPIFGAVSIDHEWGALLPTG